MLRADTAEFLDGLRNDVDQSAVANHVVVAYFLARRAGRHERMPNVGGWSMSGGGRSQEAAPRPASRALRRRTLAVEAADSLRDMILTGELTAGARMTQDDLARTLGISTMPVREALLRLASEGFVSISPNRSFSVVPLTREDVSDVFWIHATLAGELTKRAVENVDDEFVSSLRDLEKKFLDAKRAGDPVRMGKTNWEFHRAINEAASARKLLFILRSSLRFVPQGFYTLVPEWAGASEPGHEAIVAAFEQREAEAARRAAEAHVREAGEILIGFFTNRGYWTRPGGAE